VHHRLRRALGPRLASELVENLFRVLREHLTTTAGHACEQLGRIATAREQLADVLPRRDAEEREHLARLAAGVELLVIVAAVGRGNGGRDRIGGLVRASKG